MKIIFSIVSLILILIFTLALIFSDTQKSTYENKKEVIKDNAIQRGWIPEILPDSAFEIVEVHNLDTNKFEGSFKYSENDENEFVNQLKNLNGKLIWENFQFFVDKTNNTVKFKNK